MGGSELGCCANLIRFALIIINIFFGALGIVVLAVGIWALVANQDFAVVTGNSIASGAAILIVAGIVTLIICIIGIIGAIFKLRPMLLIYAIAVLIIVILEIVAGIVAFVFSDNLVSGLEGRYMTAIDQYRVLANATDLQQDVNNAIDAIQSTFGCCGFNNATDWFVNPNAVRAINSIPGCGNCTVGTADPNCATFTNITSFTTTNEGCGDFTTNRFVAIGYAVGGVGIAFGILEIVGILFALFLCCCIIRARKQEVV